MFSWVPTRKVKGGEGIRFCPSDHVGDFVHDTLLGQILPSMLAVSQSGHHFNSCRSDEEKRKEGEGNRTMKTLKNNFPTYLMIYGRISHFRFTVLMAYLFHYLTKTSSPVSSSRSWEMTLLLAQ